MNFELGDRVKCVGDVFNKGAIGIVSKVAVDYIEVKFNDREIYGYPYSYLEKIDLERKEGDLISRQAVLDGIEELKKSPWATDKRGTGFEYLIAESLDTVRDLVVKQMPSVENKGENRPKEHWIYPSYPNNYPYMWKSICSNCNTGFPTINKDYKFCPNCGAKMKGGE